MTVDKFGRHVSKKFKSDDMTFLEKRIILRLNCDVDNTKTQVNKIQTSLNEVVKKLSVFNITKNFISVDNKRIVKSASGLNSTDLVTKAQLDKAIDDNLSVKQINEITTQVQNITNALQQVTLSVERLQKQCITVLRFNKLEEQVTVSTQRLTEIEQKLTAIGLDLGNLQKQVKPFPISNTIVKGITNLDNKHL
ncbi:hypothetical protein ABEB36_000004 [Hypothenemus hampei]|uniref:Uncharacterized protein n=1 Tax=Hypothenemus hampei TaxID=57062 RepID=A0ABD1FAP4_HYPHA